MLNVYFTIYVEAALQHLEIYSLERLRSLRTFYYSIRRMSSRQTTAPARRNSRVDREIILSLLPAEEIHKNTADN